MDFNKFKERYQKKSPIEYPSTIMGTPKLSVVLVTYQHGNFIKECIDGILAQETTFQFELLIGEDNSNDGTREICIEYAIKFPKKIRLILHNRENQISIFDNPTGNFNAFYNFFSAKGKYIAFCEGDDIWSDPLKLQKEVDFLENNPQYILTYHKFTTIDANNEVIKSETERLQPDNDISSKDLQKVTYHPLLLCTCFRNVITEIPPEILQVMNVDTFLFSLLGQYGEGKFLNNIQPSRYRTHAGGIWSKRNKQKKLFSKILTYDKLIQFYSRKGDNSVKCFFQAQRFKYFKMLLYNLLKSGNIILALKTSMTFYTKKI